ncbi:MAG: hypothetical protein MZV64_17255 [Ignavibacteriales bacterium]|nr:hypothetical protein [Ignavibacteriales bacterium]
MPLPSISKSMSSARTAISTGVEAGRSTSLVQQSDLGLDPAWNDPARQENHCRP